MQRARREVTILDPREMFILAEEYLRASRMLIRAQRAPNFDARLIVPRPNVMVHAVCLEIMLKCLFVLDRGTVPPKWHNLKRLFELLLPETQQKMRECFDPTAGQAALDDYRRRNRDALPLGLPSQFTFDFALLGSSRAFEHVRFAYERGSRPTEQWFGEPLVNAAKQVILERNPTWANAPTIASTMPIVGILPSSVTGSRPREGS